MGICTEGGDNASGRWGRYRRARSHRPGVATTADKDVLAPAGTRTFAPGETTKTISIEVKGDSKREANEYFYLELYDNSSNSLFTKNRGTGTILNEH